MKKTTIHTLASGLLFGTVAPYAHASGGLSSPIDDGSFGEAEKQKMLLQTLTDRQPAHISEDSQIGEGTPSVPRTKVDELKTEADGTSRAFGVVRAKGSTTDIDIKKVDVKAAGTSKAIAYYEGDVDMS